MNITVWLKILLTRLYGFILSIAHLFLIISFITILILLLCDTCHLVKSSSIRYLNFLELFLQLLLLPAQFILYHFLIKAVFISHKRLDHFFFILFIIIIKFLNILYDLLFLWLLDHIWFINSSLFILNFQLLWSNDLIWDISSFLI